MTDTLTAEQLAELDALETSIRNRFPASYWLCLPKQIADAIPALIAMAKRCADLESQRLLLTRGAGLWRGQCGHYWSTETNGKEPCPTCQARADRDNFRDMAVRLAKMTNGQFSLKDSDQFAKDISALLEEVSHE